MYGNAVYNTRGSLADEIIKRREAAGTNDES